MSFPRRCFVCRHINILDKNQNGVSNSSGISCDKAESIDAVGAKKR